MSKATDNKFKVVLFGDNAVGKCELLYSLTCHSHTVHQTPLNVITKSFQIDNKLVELQIWNLSGNKRFLPLSNDYKRDISGAMVVYDVTCRSSFESIRKWCSILDREKIAIMILGNKCDMTDNRVVTTEEAEKVSVEIGITFVETSATENINVIEAFAALGKDILMRNEIQNFERFIALSEEQSNASVANAAEVGSSVKFSNSTFCHILRHGLEENYHIRVMIVGNEGVGKSTLLKRLLRKSVNIKKYISTNGIDVHIHSCNVDIETGIWHFEETQEASGVGILWKHIVSLARSNSRKETIEESRNFHLRVAKMMQNQRVLQQIKNKQSPVLLEMENKTEDTKDEVEKLHEDGCMQEAKQADETDDAAKAYTRQSSCDNSSSPVHSIDNDDIETIITKSKSLKSIRKRPTARVDFYDFAGQLVFHASHPTFLSSNAIFILTFDMNRLTNEQVHERRDAEETQTEMSSVGNRGIVIKSIFFWLNIVYMFAASKQNTSRTHPQVILVGTHADKLPKANRDDFVNWCFRRIRCLLADSPLKTVLSEKEFVVDNTRKTDPSFAELQAEIFSLAKLQPNWGEQTPSKWLPLEREIQSEREAGVKVMPVRHIKQLNSGLEVNIPDDAELQLLLQYLHDSGEILYFNETTLSDYVVLDPVWLIDALKTIITADQFAIRSPNQAQKWKQFCETGIIYKSTIVSIFKENSEDPELIDNYEHVLKLMEKFLFIVSPINLSSCLAENVDTSVEKDVEYIVPSMVQNQVDTKLITLAEGSSSTTVFCMVSKNNFLPSAVFHKLLAKCISKWQIVEQNGRKQIFSDVCKFNLDYSRHYKLTVFSRKHAIHAKIVSFIDVVRPEPVVCKLVNDFLVGNLRGVLASMGFSDEFRTCIQCPRFSPITSGGYLDMDIMRTQEFITCDECLSSHVMQTVDLVGGWTGREKVISNDRGDDLKCQMQNPVKAPGSEKHQMTKYEEKSIENVSEHEQFAYDAPITQEHLNHARVCNALVTVCAEGLRDILLSHVPPNYSNFYQLLLANGPYLTAQKMFRQDQINIMFPDPRGRYTGTVDQFDITLLYSLIRNISSVPTPVTGWGKPPDDNPRDTSLAANTERIRLCRNRVSGHSIDGKLDDQTFKEYWKEICMIMSDIEQSLNVKGYQDALKQRKDQIITPTEEQSLRTTFTSFQAEVLSAVESVTEKMKNLQSLVEEHA